MSYNYRPKQPPRTQVIPELVRWVHRELQRISENIVLRRAGWQDHRTPLTSSRAFGAKDPGFSKIKDDGSGSQGVYSWLFDASTEEELFFEVQVPHARVKHSDLRPHIHWLPTTTNTGTVRWGLEYTVSNVNGTFGDTTIVYCEDPADGIAYKHQVKGWPPIDGDSIRDSAVLLCRVFRDATHANDTYTGDAAGISVDFHVLMAAHGSDEEFGQV